MNHLLSQYIQYVKNYNWKEFVATFFLPLVPQRTISLGFASLKMVFLPLNPFIIDLSSSKLWILFLSFYLIRHLIDPPPHTIAQSINGTIGIVC